MAWLSLSFHLKHDSNISCVLYPVVPPLNVLIFPRWVVPVPHTDKPLEFLKVAMGWSQPCLWSREAIAPVPPIPTALTTAPGPDMELI